MHCIQALAVARRRQSGQTGEARHDGVALFMPQVRDAPSSDQDQGEQTEDHRYHAEVRAGESRTRGATQHGGEAAFSQVLPDKLESGMGGHFLPARSVLHLAVDTAPQICFPRSHWEWPFAEGVRDLFQPREYPIP